MKARRNLTLAAVVVTAVGLGAAPAQGTIHEIVAAYCSGGGHGAIGEDGFLEPSGISDPTAKNFARPVLANGVVVITATGPVTTDRPATKFPAGSDPRALDRSMVTHASSNCAAMRP